MNYGSSHVYVYSDCSDEEYVSDAELEEGMYLSMSDDDSPNESSPKLGGGGDDGISPQQLMEGSTTKYLPPESTDTDDEEEIPTLKPAVALVDVSQASGGSGTGGMDKEKRVNYVDLQLQDKSKKSGTKGEESLPNYVMIQSVNTAPLPPRPKVAAATPIGSVPPPPPQAPKKGIMKNRLNSHRLKRVRKARIVEPDPTGPAGPRSRDRGRVWRKNDTNILAVKFNKLIEPSDVHTGDAVFCSGESCSAILSHLSTITDQPDKDEKVWTCEFCGERNEVDIVPEEKPTQQDTTFLISPAPVGEGAAGGVPSMEESLVVFCIDVSGSMCVTTEIPGKFELKGHDHVKALSSLNVHNEDQYLPRQRKDTTYISRLQSVQAAVDFQLSQLARTNPSHKVALVTFSDEVSLIGDGRGNVVTLAGDKLWSSDAIVNVGGEVPLPAAIATSSKTLSQKVFELEEGGQTALGPGLLVSVALASRTPGSKVIICTDGLANKGVGNLDGLKSPEDKAAAQTFYEDLGTLSLEKNLTVSLVRIKGTDCKALELGQVADKTGGQVTTVDPLNITKEFSSILANPIIATQVKTKIILNGQLYFRSEDSQASYLVIPVGNVTAETELTYEYGVRNKSNNPTPPSSEGQKVPQLMIDGKPHLLFQLQIEYTGRDGSRCMRVITEAKPITKDRKEAERDIHMGVIGSHAAHTTAKLAMEGEYTQARLSALTSQRLLQRSSHTSSNNREQYATVMEDLIPLEQVLKTKQQSERECYGRQYSDNEEEEECGYEMTSSLIDSPLAQPSPQDQAAGSATASPRKVVRKKKKAVSRREEVSDDLATYCYNMKQHNYHEL